MTLLTSSLVLVVLLLLAIPSLIVWSLSISILILSLVTLMIKNSLVFSSLVLGSQIILAIKRGTICAVYSVTLGLVLLITKSSRRRLSVEIISSFILSNLFSISTPSILISSLLVMSLVWLLHLSWSTISVSG